jgi:hypothetical protein
MKSWMWLVGWSVSQLIQDNEELDVVGGLVGWSVSQLIQDNEELDVFDLKLLQDNEELDVVGLTTDAG